MPFRAFTTLVFALGIPGLAAAEDYKVGSLVISDPVARETPSTARTGAGYMTITNTGDTADRLIAVKADYPRVEIHDVKVEDDIASMFKIEGAEIAPGESITLQPGQKHVMFMGLDGNPFKVGDRIAATLVFEAAGDVDVVFDVATGEAIMEAFGTSSHGHGHGGHGDKKDSDGHSHDHN